MANMSAVIRNNPILKSNPSYKLLAGVLSTGSVLTYIHQKRHYQNNNGGSKNGGNNNNNNNNNGDFKKVAGPLLGAGIILNSAEPVKGKTFEDYQEVYNDIAAKIHEDDGMDEGDGRYGLLCRLAWHTSATFDKKDGTGGSYAGTMGFPPELTDIENRGLEYGRAFLLLVKEKYTWISLGDLWTLGGVTAVQEAGGPKIKWRPGRKDLKYGDGHIVENGRLPDASRDAPYVRNLFQRIGFNDQEAVALIGAHCLGQCHPDRSGFDGPWSPSPDTFNNQFFIQLLKGWHYRKWDGPKQWEDDDTKELMMLPTDMALKQDSAFLKYVKIYAKDESLFFKDFSNAYATLLEKGIDFPESSKPFTFKTLHEQEEDKKT